jgi:ribonuclease P protein component
MTATYSFNKKEKLKSRKLLDQLFTKGRSVSVFPVKVFYLLQTDEATESIRAGVGVSAKNFSKAVDRNRIKRLLREAYRLNKSSLHNSASANQKKLAAFFLYVGKEMPDFTSLNQTMQAALSKLESAIVKA